MKTEICILEKNFEDIYENFITTNSNALIYHSLTYKKFLYNSILNTIHKYIVAVNGKRILAVVPCIIKLSEKGNILNSLPFFGSHGSILGAENLKELEIKKIFLKLNELIDTYNIKSVTIVDNYKKNNLKIINKYFKYQFIEKRFSQVTNLANIKNFITETGNNNFVAYFKGNRRTDIRKGQNNKYVFAIDNSVNSLKALYNFHKKNIKNLGGVKKNWKIFKNLNELYIKTNKGNIFTVKDKNKIVCSILLLYYKETVYYFIPGMLDSYKSKSVMSNIIFIAMNDSIKKGYSYWDWGGSWLSQKNLIKYKNSWQAENVEYSYYINYSKKINNLNKENILDYYKYFFVKPFEIK